MYKKIESWFEIQSVEEKILSFWEAEEIFNKVRVKNENGEPWSFIDGPITANNPMGVHHAWGRSLKDAYQRYWAMNGRKLRYQNGFDCQGLWVEVEVEKELGFKTKKDIENYGVDKFITKCKERVTKYSEIIRHQSIRLGYWMDWENSYYTMSWENNYTIWNFLSKSHEKGHIYKGHDVMPWCPRCGTGLSQHEMHEGYKNVTHTSLYLRFPIEKDSKEAFLVWTTTPWTLTSNIALAVNPDLTYSRVQQGEWIYYIVKDRINTVLKDKGSWKILNEISGRELINKRMRYHAPYDDLPCRKNIEQSDGYHRIISWDEVSPDEGTGIVHIAPGCGAEDFHLGQENNLPIIDPIDDGGIFKDDFGHMTGKHAQSIKDEVVHDMEAGNMLYAAEEYEHKYPHCWRCNNELLYRLVDEWFIEIDSWRNNIKENTKKIDWYPSFGLDLEIDWLSNMHDWMISKKRYWGLALPIWECEQCGNFTVISGIEELQEKALCGIEDVLTHGPHKPWIDGVKITCPQCGNKISRIPDVGNPWLDAGIVPYSTVQYNTDKEYWKKWVPGDLIVECFPGQFRNWFYSLLAMSTMMEDIPPAKTIVGHALVKDAHGEDMHKSKGNAVWFDDAVKEIGAEVIRWQFFINDISTDVHFSFDNARLVRGKFFNTLWNSYAFYVNYARLSNFHPGKDKAQDKKNNIFDRWILSNLHYTIQECRKYYEAYNLKGASRYIEHFIDQLSNWYIRHSRRRFWKSENSEDSNMAYETLYESLYNITLLLAPMLPMLTEEIYQNMVRAGDKTARESIHLVDFPRENRELIDMSLIDEMDIVKKIIALGMSMRNKEKIKVRQPLQRITVAIDDPDEIKILKDYASIIAEDLNVKEVDITDKTASRPVENVMKPNYKNLGPRYGAKTGEIAQAVTDYIKDRGTALEVPFIIETDDVSVTIGPEDLISEEKTPPHLSVIDYKTGWIALDRNISEDLEKEGIARDFIRHIQVERKNKGLEPEDKITVDLTVTSEKIRQALEDHKTVICQELLCDSISEKSIATGTKIKLREERIIVHIAKRDLQPGGK